VLSLAHTTQHPKRHLDWFSRFFWAYDHDGQTNQHTDHAILYVAIGCIYVVLLRSLKIECGLRIYITNLEWLLCRSSLTTEGKMWRVPPIQFIMDDTVRQMREVEELLAVADMGPDFELGSSMTSEPSLACEQKTTNPSCRSDINVSEVPGPGDSVELVSGDHKQSFAEHSETWNNVYENTRSLQTPEDAIAEKLDEEKIGCDKAVSVDDEMAAAHDRIQNDSHRCRSKHAKAAGSEDTRHTSEVRSDIYGLDHARLWQQVLLAKRKSVNRSYGLSDELIAHYSAAADGAKTVSTRDLLARSKLRKRNKNGRRCRNPDYFLSCHYHNNVED